MLINIYSYFFQPWPLWLELVPAWGRLEPGTRTLSHPPTRLTRWLYPTRSLGASLARVAPRLLKSGRSCFAFAWGGRRHWTFNYTNPQSFMRSSFVHFCLIVASVGGVQHIVELMTSTPALPPSQKKKNYFRFISLVGYNLYQNLFKIKFLFWGVRLGEIITNKKELFVNQFYFCRFC